MSMNLPTKIWVLAERLYISRHGTDEFIDLLKEQGVEYSNDLYSEFGKTKPLYTFMSEENYDFANFMQTVPNYKYLKILEKIIFDRKVFETKNDYWNYYGERIRNWYPSLIELLDFAKVNRDVRLKKLSYLDEDYESKSEDFLPYAFNDPFLDYIRKELNESYEQDLYLSVMFLSRKIVEVIFIRLFEVVFPKLVNGKYCDDNHNLWYDIERNGYRSFTELIDNMRDNASAFHEDKSLIQEFCSIVKPLKKETNSCVHSDYKVPDAGYVRDWRVAYVVNLGRKLFKKYCNP